MKRTLAKPVLSVFVFLMAITASLPAMAGESKMAFPVDKNLYYINGQEKAMEAKTFVSGGRTYVPLRYLAEAMGAEVKWLSDGGSHGLIILKKGGSGVVFRLNSKDYTIIQGNQATLEQMDVTPVSRENRLYLPARPVAEAFGYQMNFDATTNSVQIYGSGNQPPIIDIPEQPAPEAIKPDPALVNDLFTTLLALYTLMIY